MAAITFPMAFDDFVGLMKIQSVELDLQRMDEIDGLENGQLLTAGRSRPLWSGSVNLASMSYDDAVELSAAINALDGSINSFYFYTPPRLYPKSDPTGSILGANVVTIDALDADNKRLTLEGLPVGYTLTRGDGFAFDFASGTRRAFHRVVGVAPVVADGSGQAVIEVRPHIMPGTVVTTVVTLKKPMIKAIIVPGSLTRGTISGQRVTGKSFEIMQRL